MVFPCIMFSINTLTVTCYIIGTNMSILAPLVVQLTVNLGHQWSGTNNSAPTVLATYGG